jgi:hypothetical protein
MTNTLYEDVSVYMIVSPDARLRIISISDKICRENQNTHFIFNKFCSQIRAVYEVMWKSMVEPDRPQMTI